MDNRKKNAIYSLLLVAVMVAVWFYRNDNNSDTKGIPYLFITGEAQGTTYNINYQDDQSRNFKAAIDSILNQFDNSLSTYKSGSEIIRFNQSDSLIFELPFFYPVLKKSSEIYQASEGAFDPTVYPLIAAWGFGPQKTDFPDTARIKQIMAYVGFDLINFDKEAVKKATDSVSLDFNAIAQGYSIDIIHDFLEKQGIENMMVELGGELRVKGRNENGDLWSIGIDDPKVENQQAERIAIIKLNGQAISTSGNYRKFFVHNGIKYGHTIDPRTGFPIQRDIVSATVIAPTCMEADAWSTAFMVTGLKGAKEILANQPNLAAFFVYEDENGELQQFYTDNLSDSIIL